MHLLTYLLTDRQRDRQTDRRKNITSFGGGSNNNNAMNKNNNATLIAIGDPSASPKRKLLQSIGV